VQKSIAIEELKSKAEQAKFLYRTRQITREEAQAEIVPYLEQFNIKSKEVAKKYGVKPKLVNFVGWIR
jgi:hypothetical protein